MASFFTLKWMGNRWYFDFKLKDRKIETHLSSEETECGGRRPPHRHLDRKAWCACCLPGKRECWCAPIRWPFSGPRDRSFPDYARPRWRGNPAHRGGNWMWPPPRPGTPPKCGRDRTDCRPSKIRPRGWTPSPEMSDWSTGRKTSDKLYELNAKSSLWLTLGVKTLRYKQSSLISKLFLMISMWPFLGCGQTGP